MTLVLSIDVGIRNFCFSIVHFSNQSFDVQCIEKVQIGEPGWKGHDLANAMIAFLHTSSDISSRVFDYVLVESQVCHAVKNTILSYVVVTYFMTMCRVRGMEETKIHFIPPRSKFDAVYARFPGLKCIGENSNQNQHRITKGRSKDQKDLSVELAKAIFDEYNVVKGFEAFSKYYPKLDDVADTFLQSFCVLVVKTLHKHKPFTR